jgi:dihydroorotase
VELVREAKARGLAVTAEVTPHHLSLTDSELSGYDTSLKVNPPLREESDRAALRSALSEGTIDVIGTDHAPHSVEEKEVEFDQAPMGTIGLETALAVVWTELVEPEGISPLRAFEAMSTAPARILSARGHGGPVAPGSPANLVIFDPGETWVVEPPFASKSRNCAFTGRSLRGRVRHTMLRGDFTLSDGKPTR